MPSASLPALARDHLTRAGQSASGRSSHTLYGGQGHVLRQTLLALRGGHQLAEHESPGEATLQVLEGRVRLVAGEESVDGDPGDHLPIPPVRHSLLALDDAVVLLTVVVPAAR